MKKKLLLSTAILTAALPSVAQTVLSPNGDYYIYPMPGAVSADGKSRITLYERDDNDATQEAIVLDRKFAPEKFDLIPTSYQSGQKEFQRKTIVKVEKEETEQQFDDNRNVRSEFTLEQAKEYVSKHNSYYGGTPMEIQTRTDGEYTFLDTRWWYEAYFGRKYPEITYRLSTNGTLQSTRNHINAEGSPTLVETKSEKVIMLNGESHPTFTYGEALDYAYTFSNYIGDSQIIDLGDGSYRFNLLYFPQITFNNSPLTLWLVLDTDGTLTEYTATYSTDGITVTTDYGTDWSSPITEEYHGEVFTYEEAEKKAKDAFWGTVHVKAEGEATLFIKNDYYLSKQEYPKQYFKLNADGTLYRTSITYSHEYTDGWEEVQSVWGGENLDHYTTAISGNFLDMDNNTQWEGVLLTQNFFNNDDKYEYLMPICNPTTEETEYDNDGDGINEKKYVRYDYDRIGFKVMSQSGREAAKFILPSGYNHATSDVIFMMMDNERYLLVEAFPERDNHNTAILAYKVDAATSSVRQMSAPIHIGVMPRVARRSEPVTVTFGDEGKTSRRVKVTGMNGSTVIAESVAAGETATTIDTSALSQGVYVVTVEDGEKAVENCKIVIR